MEEGQTPEKCYISPDELRVESFRLAARMYASGFRPDFMLALWRGGATIGCYVHEFLETLGLKVDHIAIRTSRTQTNGAFTVKVHNLRYLVETVTKDTKLLIVDDVSDSGETAEAVLRAIKESLGDRTPTDIRLAMLYYKPTKNVTGRKPDYFLHTTDQWLVFPHELKGLSRTEILNTMGAVVNDIISMCT